jgi:archaellum biogenesis ATPase FlaH
MMIPLERTILRQLLDDTDFAAKVVPYLKSTYFHTAESVTIFKLYEAFYHKYKVSPSLAALRIGIDASTKLSEEESKRVNGALTEIEHEPALASDQQAWLLEQTEEYVQERAVYCALQESIKLMDDPAKSKHAITDLMKEALSVTFDTHVGHDWDHDAEPRWNFYHKPEVKIPFDLTTLNTMTKNGVPKKTLNIVLAGTNVGKSLFLTHFAASCLRLYKNVLYITLEMAEEWIAQRIDANMMDLPMDDVEALPKDMYLRKMEMMRKTGLGKLIIKEYPTATGHAGHFRALLQELRLKQNFIPDVLIIDYLTICASSRVKLGTAGNTYVLDKFIAEELRGLATECDVPVFTAAQFNRKGAEDSNPSMTDVADSWGIPMTADFVFGLSQTEELQKVNQICLKEYKNRYNKRNSFKQHLLGIDTSRMKLYDLTAAQQAASIATPPPSSPIPTTGYKPQFGGPRQRKPLKQLKSEHKDAETE